MVDVIKKDAEVIPAKQEAVAKPEFNIHKEVSKPESVAQAQGDVLADAKATLDQIKDPVAKQLLQEKITNLEKHFNQKYMKVSEDQKALEAERAKLNQPWTPEKLKAELQRQDFINSAQMLQSEQAPANAPVSQEQWSYLTPEERGEIMRPIQNLQKQVEGLQIQNQSVMRDKIDTTMKSKWGDYDPSKVDSFLGQVNNRQISDEQLIEMSWKALNYDRYVERAHKLGLEGRQIELQEKQQGSSFSSGNGHTNPQQEPPKREANESSPNYFKKLADWRRGRMAG